MRTFSLQSGSNGNAIYVEADNTCLLFDAGISGRQARLRMQTHARDVANLDALIVSHGHADHARCLGVMHRLFKIPVYMTPATHSAVAPYVGKLSDVRYFAPGERLRFGPVTVHTIPTPHDADQSVAFVVECGAKRLGIFTDLGHPFHALPDWLRDLDAAYLESNYDPTMLAEGQYPPQLQARIRGDGGHLSNDEAAALLKHSCISPKWVALAHLSEHNNDPDVALETHRRILGPNYPLHIASRYSVSRLLSV